MQEVLPVHIGADVEPTTWALECYTHVELRLGDVRFKSRPSHIKKEVGFWRIRL